MRYPRYELVVNGKPEWHDMPSAAATYDNGFAIVRFGRWVQDGPDDPIRRMNDDDEALISDAADRYSENK